MATGVTPQGFVAKTVQDLLSDVETAELANIDPALDTSPSNPIGQLNGIFCDKLADLWALASVAYNGMSRDNAEGPQLDNVNGLTGTKRKSASPSYTLQTNVFSQDGTYPAGALVANMVGLPSVQYANGDTLIVSTVGGTHQAAIGTTVLASGSLPLTVSGMKFFCTVDGPTITPAGQLTVITTPVTGWSSTTNPTDAVEGSLIEKDEPYRLRGEEEIGAAGSGNPDAMRADLLNVPGVIEAFVVENVGNTFDVFNNPPHTFLTIIWDGASPAASNDAVAQAIWNDKPTGIPPSSAATLAGTALDTNNVQHVMGFNRATQLLLYLNVNVKLFPGVAFTADLQLAIKTAIVQSTITKFLTTPNGTPALNPAYLGLGNNVVAEAIKGTILTAGLGISDVTLLQLGFAPTPVNTTNLTVTQLQIALADTSRIVVTNV